jgi:hypothetical protein
VKIFGFWQCHIARENPNTGSIAGKRIDRPMQASARFFYSRDISSSRWKMRSFGSSL